MRLVRAYAIFTNVGYIYLVQVIAEDNLEVKGLGGLEGGIETTRIKLQVGYEYK
jgi:hypothetical protein